MKETTIAARVNMAPSLVTLKSMLYGDQAAKGWHIIESPTKFRDEPPLGGSDAVAAEEGDPHLRSFVHSTNALPCPLVLAALPQAGVCCGSWLPENQHR